MKLVIPSRLTNLEIVHQMVDLLNGYNLYKKNNPDIDVSIGGYLDDKAYDYVKEFINIVDDTLDEPTISYLINIFYKSKGTYSIFELMSKYLKVKFKSPPIYTVDKLELDIESVSTIDMSRYKISMENFLMSLLYYKDFKSIIDLLNLYITNYMYTKSSISSNLYKEYELSFDNRDLI